MNSKLRSGSYVLVLVAILSVSGYYLLKSHESRVLPAAKRIDARSGQIPPLLMGTSVGPDVLVNAANYYISIGETATIEELLAFEESATKRDLKLDVHERIGWLCRILYTPKTSLIRPPKFGVLVFPHRSMTLDDWPIFPLARSGDTFCVFTQGYVLGGKTEQIGCVVFGTEPIERTETISDYLKYCRQHGMFRTQQLNVPSRAEAVSDLTTLIESDLWKKIKWREDVPKLLYDYNGDWFGTSIIKQASTIESDIHPKDKTEQ